MGDPDFDLDEGNWAAGNRSTGKLSWRGDPAATFSDWVIEVRADDEVGGIVTRKQSREPGIPTRFHVHKTVLAFGERASAYFNTQFNLTCATIETRTSTTALEIPAVCLPCMPLFLDFVYEGKAEWKEENVVPLMELARRLEVPALGRSAMAWLKTKLSSSSFDGCVQFLEHATELKMEKVQAAALKVLVRQFDKLDADITNSLPFSMLIEILQSDDLAVVSEDKVFDVIVYRLNKTCAEGDAQRRQLWECLRFAFLTLPKQQEALTHESLPRDLFLEDAVASLCLHQRGLQAVDEFRTTVPAKCASRLVPRALRIGAMPQSLSISGVHTPAQSENTLEALFDGCFETGVCTTSFGSSPGWVTMTFASPRQINKLQASGYHGNTRAWHPTNGVGASVEFSVDGVSYVRCGEVPESFGRTLALVDIPLSCGPIFAKHVRFKKQGTVGLSQVRIE